MRLPHRLEQLRPALDPTFAFDQRAQQLELDGRQLDLAAIDRHPMRAPVQGDGSRRDEPAGRHRGCAEPAQHRADPQHQLLGRERLGEIVVGAEGESFDPVGLFLARGENDDAQVLRLLEAAQLGQHVVPGRARQHQVEHDEVGSLFPSRPERVAAIRGRRDAVPRLGEMIRHERGDIGLVVDHEDSVRRRLAHSDVKVAQRARPWQFSAHYASAPGARRHRPTTHHPSVPSCCRHRARRAAPADRSAG